MKKHILISVSILVAIGIGWSFLRSISKLHRRNSEGNTMGRLGAIRSALSIYYGDMEGQYPTDLTELTRQYQRSNGRPYLTSIEVAQCASPYHRSPNCSDNMQPGVHDKIHYGSTPDDSSGWGYDNGQVFVNCTHTDVRGTVYAAY